MGETGEKNSEPVERTASQCNDARPFAVRPETAEERGKSQNENADRKREGYLRNAPSELLRERRAENAPRIDRTERDLEEHSRDRDYPAIIGSHRLIITALSQHHSWELHRRLPCRCAGAP